MIRIDERALGRALLVAAAALVVGCVPAGNNDDGDGDGEDGGVMARDRGARDDAEARIIDASPTRVDAEAEPCEPTGDDVCNGLDDDCDGVADEGYGVGGECSVGEGACAATGVRICEGGGAVCDAVAGDPAAETCNGADDDCDGAVDEGYDVGVACSINEAECVSRGEMVCNAGGDGTVCGAAPIVVQDELCNAADDDCDGSIDEGIVLGELCEVGEGLCRRGGFTECAEDGQVICSGRAGPPGEEACNGFDDDCDGVPDEDFGGEPCSAGIGGCLREGFRVCTEAGDLACNVTAGEPRAEVCNDIDDDCDGTVDEGYAELLGEPCTVGLGVCARESIYQCDPEGRGGGYAFEGIRQNVPLEEIVDGGFEECFSGTFNGRENIAQILENCSEGVLLLGCMPNGAEALTLAAMGERGEVLTDVGNGNAAVHNHNGVDWYFNDSHSWGFAPEGVGVSRNSCDTNNMQPELRMCWHTSAGGLSSGYRCGNQFLNGNAGWTRVVYHKPDGPGVICDVAEGEPAGPDACNGQDDDCDGLTDEETPGLGEPCEGIELEVCQAAQIGCTAAGEIECVAVPTEPQEEFCNDYDDDCDGTVDEDFALGEACAVGVGACTREGVTVCDDLGGVGGGRLAFEGIRQDVPFDELRAAGFEPCWQGTYGERAPAVAQILEQCDGEQLLLGCGPIAADSLQLAATGERAEVLTDVGNVQNAVHSHNGVDWYFNDSYSWGFTGEGDGVSRNSCDTAQVRPELRMCWHTSAGTMSTGYRCGATTVSNGTFRRVIWQRAGGPGSVCSVEPGEPEVEACNNLDDDCDEAIDEEIPGTGEVCDEVELAACQAGLTACVDGAGIECVAVDLEPGIEFCNAIDDDCDGTVDEDFAELGEPCVEGVGICANEGTYACQQFEGGAGGGGAGLPFVGIQQNVPLADIEGQGFEQCWAGLYGGNEPIAPILEACGEGVLMLGCRPVGADALTLAAAGLRDEVLTDVGVGNVVHNHNGVDWYFNAGQSWGFAGEGDGVSRNSCDTANVRPELRMCWHTSNGNVTSGYRCGGTFLNGNNGWERVIYQRPDGPGMVCSAQAGEPLEAEVCNGDDDDCDGVTDEEIEGVGDDCFEGVGACETGVSACDPDGGLMCLPVPIEEPSEEICNGFDDDCDGEVDNLPGRGDACGFGVGRCATPGTLDCPADGGVQLIEGVMNDVVIADMQRIGFEQCYAGRYNENVPIAPILEGCPGDVMLIGCREAGQENLRVAAMGLREDVLFDTGDGNAAVHEANGVNWYYSDLWSWGFAPAGQAVNRNSCDTNGGGEDTRMCWHTGGGNLEFGWRCGSNTAAGANTERFVFVADRIGGDLECVPDPDAPPPLEPVGEACNAIDDDCDGTVDEDFDDGGPCAAGVGACRAAGTLVCNADGNRVCDAVPGEPGVEECNGRDDDCDARIDEELLCP